jgi:diguanylate cyclase (GGDEF)-like protein
MQSLLGLRSSKPNSSPLEGLGTLRAQQAEAILRQLARREWWLWLSAFFVTTLSAIGFLLTAFHSFFLHSEHFYEIRPDQARWGIMSLLLIFNGWLVLRQWTFRRIRKQFLGEGAATEADAAHLSDPAGLDPATGLYNRAFIEQQLGKEIVRAKRQNSALSLATIHLDDFQEINRLYGPSATDSALKELARRLRKACRGSDYAARLASDDFLLVLPECGLGEVKLVLNRLGSLEMTCSGRKISLTCTTGWVDYQPGDMPSDLLKRAAQILHLYETAAQDSFSSTPAPH